MSDEPEETFGDWVLKQRESLGVSRNVLAEAVGVSSEYIRRIELGLNAPSIAVRWALTSALSNENDMAAMRAENQLTGKISKAFSDWVLKQRESRGISRKSLGKIVGVSSEYIRRIELGRHNPSVAVRVALEAALSKKSLSEVANDVIAFHSEKNLADLIYKEMIQYGTGEPDFAKTLASKIIKAGYRKYV